MPKKPDYHAIDSLAEPRNGNPYKGDFLTEHDGQRRLLILEELERILNSPSFRKSERSREFLRYVVSRALEGPPESLKERTIGVELFQRPPDYATGDDPIVRVQAGEVRRRLEQFYQSPASGTTVRIELPVGSYAPEFHSVAPQVPVTAADHAPAEPLVAAPPAHPLRYWIIGAICFSLVFVAAGAWRHLQRQQSSIAQQFWAPVFATRQPVLICLAKGVTYRPGLNLYRMYARSHPGTFQNEIERSNDPLPLDSNQPLQWGDMQLFQEYGVADGDVAAALDVSTFLGKIGKPLQVRIGTDTSFADLRESPAIVLGAFNNKWTMELTSGLHFAFIEGPERDFLLREQVPGGRVWHTEYDSAGATVRDYGVVTRLLQSQTGQFTIALAGIGANGTEAATELVSDENALGTALKNAPRNWQAKNLQIVVETDIIDSVPGPPRVVATYYW